MAVKYHVSPDTGRPNICRAEKNDCPVGGTHYASKDDARAGYEKEMASTTLAPTVSKNAYESPFKPRQVVKGSTVWNYKSLVEEGGGRRKFEAAHPDLAFTEGPDGELVVEGPAKKVEAYIQEPGGRKADINKSLRGLQPVEVKKDLATKQAPSVKPVLAEELPVLSPEDEWAEEELTLDAEPNVAFEEVEIIDIDDDFSDIKCDECKNSLDSCTCGECKFCGANEAEDEEHYEDCVLYKPKPVAYSWER